MSVRKPKEAFVSPCGVTTHDLKGAEKKHGISYRTLFAAVKGDELPARQYGVKWLVRCEDVEAWIDEHSSPNVAELERVS